MLKRSEYLDVASYEPKLEDGVQDILTSVYQANSVSDSTIRFRVVAPSSKALMDSEALIVMKVRVQAKNSAGGAVELPLQTASSIVRDGFKPAVASWAAADHENQGVRMFDGGATARIQGFSERSGGGGLWQACTQLSCEINNSSSISVRPQDFLMECDQFLIPEDQEKYWPSGPMDSGCGRAPCTEFVGRAFQINSPNRREVTFEEMGVDLGFAERCRIWRDRSERANAGDHYFTLVTRIPIAPFSYYRNGMGSSRRSMIPYISTLQLQLNFGSEREKFVSMFQCSAVQGHAAFGSHTVVCPQGTALTGINTNLVPNEAKAVTTVVQCEAQVPGGHSTCKVLFAGDDLPAPELIIKWVNPKPNYFYKDQYSFSLPRFLCYKQDIDATSTDFNDLTKGHQVFFAGIKLESLPELFLISCKPKKLSGTAPNGFQQWRTNWEDASYQNTYDSLQVPSEGHPTALQFTLNERSGLAISLSLRQLYEITCKNLPGYRHSYLTWRKDKMLLAIKPSDVGAPVQANVYSPQTITISMRWCLGNKHKALTFAAAGADMTDALPAAGNNGIWDGLVGGHTGVEIGPVRAKNGVPCAGVKHTVTLAMYYEDSLSLSASSASTQAFMVSENALRQPSGETNSPAIDGMEL